MEWKSKLNKLLEDGCTDSDIEDFVNDNPDISGREIWDYVAECEAPEQCLGCKYIQMSGMFPCNECVRIHSTDYFQLREQTTK